MAPNSSTMLFGFGSGRRNTHNIGLKLEGDTKIRPMRALDRGWHELETSAARPGSLYRFVLPDGVEVPDPASRFQPQDVHGPSEVIDPEAFGWDDTEWKGRLWEQSVIYELHVGAFTAEGTFRATMERLDYLRDLGVTVIELMPIADFPGERNWGYDGVLLLLRILLMAVLKISKPWWLRLMHVGSLSSSMSSTTISGRTAIISQPIRTFSLKSIKLRGALPSTTMPSTQTWFVI